VAHRPHLVEAARQALDFAAGVLTGDPAGGTKILEELHEREQLDDLSDREVLGRSARELCISAILACDEFQERASTLVAESPAEAALLLKALCGAGAKRKAEPFASSGVLIGFATRCQKSTPKP